MASDSGSDQKLANAAAAIAEMEVAKTELESAIEGLKIAKAELDSARAVLESATAEGAQYVQRVAVFGNLCLVVGFVLGVIAERREARGESLKRKKAART